MSASLIQLGPVAPVWPAEAAVAALGPAGTDARLLLHQVHRADQHLFTHYVPAP